MWTRNNPLYLDEDGLPILADKVAEFKGQRPIVIVDSYAKIVPKEHQKKMKDLQNLYMNYKKLLRL